MARIDRFAAAIRRFRRRAGFTQRELARRLGTSQPYVAQLELGKRVNPTQATIRKLARALRCKPSELMDL